ncbi:flagellin modification protein FlmC [Caulobacter flavus]|uniref:Flagellin modification protein FlmC n=1 Tax=Caulobacter flavus TaxID=1679497 RepID=A0A2N5CUS1_9CAUL|nr:glycosyltransferase family protein [Caulobacter flavus]AYV45007.1 flagellin modification protein FlmC [Caulobacter flavus]PLR17275.1 flagellin modification protein FlmC [Caulobacter flavus]
MIVAVLQARMSSTRLPGKVLADVAGAPMILRQVERLRRAASIERLIAATSDQASDDALARALEAAGVEVFRGSLDDVLGRFAGAVAGLEEDDQMLRLTADCPLADPRLIEALIARHLASGADYSATTLPHRTYPIGLDAEILSVGLLRLMAREATDPYEREHVTPFVYRRPERFVLDGLTQAVDESQVRWTVDLPSDLAFVRAVYEALYPGKPDFGPEDIRALVRGRPDLRALGDLPRI